MEVLLLLLISIFAGVALMVVILQRYGRSDGGDAAFKLQRWILPLVGLLLFLKALDYFLRGG